MFWAAPGHPVFDGLRYAPLTFSRLLAQLQEEVHYLRNQVDAIAAKVSTPASMNLFPPFRCIGVLAPFMQPQNFDPPRFGNSQTKVDMREQLNAQKEKYYKKMKKVGSPPCLPMHQCSTSNSC